jgi:predicted DNA-binding helix-hairpin-helix protein
VPGLGVKNVDRLITIRRHTRIRLQDLAQLRISLPKVRPFLITADHHPARELLDSDSLLARLAPKPVQLELFGHAPR